MVDDLRVGGLSMAIEAFAWVTGEVTMIRRSAAIVGFSLFLKMGSSSDELFLGKSF